MLNLPSKMAQMRELSNQGYSRKRQKQVQFTINTLRRIQHDYEPATAKAGIRPEKELWKETIKSIQTTKDKLLGGGRPIITYQNTPFDLRFKAYKRRKGWYK